MCAHHFIRSWDRTAGPFKRKRGRDCARISGEVASRARFRLAPQNTLSEFPKPSLPPPPPPTNTKETKTSSERRSHPWRRRCRRRPFLHLRRSRLPSPAPRSPSRRSAPRSSRRSGRIASPSSSATPDVVMPHETSSWSPVLIPLRGFTLLPLFIDRLLSNE